MRFAPLARTKGASCLTVALCGNGFDGGGGGGNCSPLNLENCASL